jgi:hypothetical protein
MAMRVRETTLNDAEVVRRLSRNFIPFAVDSYAATEISRKWGTKPVTSAFRIIAPDNTVVALTKKVERDELLEFLNQAPQNTEPRRASKTDSPRNLTPDRGVGIRDGIAQLAVMSRPAQPSPLSKDDHRYQEIMVATETLTEQQLDSLRPPRNEADLQYRLPEEVVRHFGAVCVHNSDGVFKVVPSDATKLPRDAKITRCENNIIEVTFQGPLATRNKVVESQGTAQGRLRFDTAGQLQELLLVYQGNLDDHYSPRKYPIEGLIEWRRNSAQEQKHTTELSAATDVKD